MPKPIKGGTLRCAQCRKPLPPPDPDMQRMLAALPKRNRPKLICLECEMTPYRGEERALYWLLYDSPNWLFGLLPYRLRSWARRRWFTTYWEREHRVYPPQEG